ncbi:Uncharacterised protein [Yersinia wautersii]|uniref:Uncharacterized protein n=2 Tax=Yersinia wautersii TaxID=1341643 RepID=A0ABP1ZH09_9GAMM|nr:Uncharacterised protein [Yersinia wautersii]
MAEGAEGYKAVLSGNDPAIAKAAMKTERFIPETISVPNSQPFFHLGGDRRPLPPIQLAEISARNPSWGIVKVEISGNRDSLQQIVVRRKMTNKERDEAIKNPSNFSHHSPIVASNKVPALAMVYD